MQGKVCCRSIFFHQHANAVVLHVRIIIIYVVRLDLKAFMQLRMRCINQLLRTFNQRVNSLPRAGADGNNRDSQFKRKALAIDFISIFFHLIHHIEGDDHGAFQFNQLNRQIEIALKVRSIHNVNNGIRALVDDVIPRNHLFHGIRGKRINAGKVYQRHLMAMRAKGTIRAGGSGFNFAFLFLYGHAGPVAYIFLAAGHRIEERGFPAVRIPCKRNAHRPIIIKNFAGAKPFFFHIAARAMLEHKAREQCSARMSFLVCIAWMLLLLQQRMSTGFMLRFFH